MRVAENGNIVESTDVVQNPTKDDTYRNTIVAKVDATLTGNLVGLRRPQDTLFLVSLVGRSCTNDSKFVVRLLPFLNRDLIPVLGKLGMRIYLHTEFFVAENLAHHASGESRSFGCNVVKGHETDLIIMRAIITNILRDNFGYALADHSLIDRRYTCMKR